MEVNAPWITCRMGKKLYLLAKDENACYLIEVGKNLDYATEEWLEQQGVSELLLKELQLPFEYIPKAALRGVAIGGNVAGCFVYLYLKSEKRKLMLELDYDPEWMDDFFSGISRFTAPVEKRIQKKETNWRREKRDRELYDKLAWVPWVIALLSICVNAGYYIFRNALWLVLWLAVLLIPVVLDILMPGYFSLIPAEKGKKKDAWELGMSVFFHLFGGLAMMNNNWLDDRPFWIVLGISAAVCFVVLLLAEEFRRESPIYLIVFALFGGIFGMGVVGEANECFPHEPPQAYVLEVEDTHKDNGRRSTRYYCTITLPDGREENLQISRSLYDDLEKGDLVRVEHGVGFFGIEYANAYRME